MQSLNNTVLYSEAMLSVKLATLNASRLDYCFIKDWRMLIEADDWDPHFETSTASGFIFTSSSSPEVNIL